MPEEISKDEILKRIEEDARRFEYEYHGCGQCTLLALQKNLNIGSDLTFKMTGPLVVGIGAMGETCGAFLAGVLAMGLIWGREKIEDGPEATLPALPPTRKFFRAFQNEFGSLTCREIQKSRLGKSYNLADSEEYQAFQKEGGYEVASGIVSKTARMAAEIILERLEKEKGGQINDK